MADLDIAVVVIIGAFVLSQEFSDVLVALQVLSLKLFQPFLGLFGVQWLHGHQIYIPRNQLTALKYPCPANLLLNS